MTRLLPRLALVASLACAFPLTSLQPASAETDFATVGSFKLPGDLEVVTFEDHASPKVVVDTWLKAGASSDFPGYPGLAEATAIALWDSGKQPVTQALRALGGEPSFEVARDTVHFSVTLPAAKLAEGMDLVGAAFSKPRWDQIDLNAVKARLNADLARYQADPDQVGESLLFAGLFGPEYGHPVAGQGEAVSRLTTADLQAFYDRTYVPGRMKVVLAGDFATGKSVGQVVRSYAAMLKRTPASVPVPTRPLAPAVSGVPSFNGALLTAGARGAAMTDEEAQAGMAMLAQVLAGDEKARLPIALAGKAQKVAAYWQPFAGPGALVIQATSNSPDTAALEKAVRDTVADLRNTPVSLDEHAHAMAHVVADYAKQNDSLAKEAATLGFYSSLAGDWRWARTYPDVVRQVSRQDLMDAAQKYLTPEALKVVVLRP